MCSPVIRQPVLWIFGVVALGTLAGQLAPVSSSVLAVAPLVAVGLVAVALRRSRGVALASLLLLLLVGAWRARSEDRPVAVPPSCADGVSVYRAMVDGPVERLVGEKGIEQRTVVRLEAERCSGFWVARSGRWGVRFSEGPELGRGDVVQLSLRLRPAAAPLNPVGLDALALARQRDLTGWARSRGAHLVVQRGSGLLARVDRARHFVSRALERDLNHHASTLAKALVLGDRADISPGRQREWADSGLAHLLSISGLHVAMVATLLYGLMRLLVLFIPGAGERFSMRRLAAALALLPLTGFCWWVGAPAPAVRSTIMAGTVFVGLAVGRPAAVPNALGIAGAAIILVSPASLGDPSFLLSFAAVGVLFAAPSVPLPRGHWLRPVVASLVASIAATLATAPLTLHFFGRVSLVAPVSNMLAVPIATLVATPLTLAYAAVASLSDSLGRLVAPIAALPLDLLEWTAHTAARWPFASLRLAPLETSALVAYAVALVGGLASFRYPRWRGVTLIALLALVGSVGWRATERSRSDDLVVVHPYVGQGDATLVLFPGGAAMLVDAGGSLDGEGWDPGEQVLAPLLAHYGVRRLDVAVVTHPHPDHLNGYAYLARELPIAELWSNGEGTTLPTFIALERAVTTSGGRVRRAVELPPVLEMSGVRIEVLHPRAQATASWGERTMSEGNNRSLVLRLTYGARSILLAGDIEHEVEARLAPSLVPTDILKSPHHGSPTSSSQPLLTALRPALVVISCGEENHFGFPAAHVLTRYADVGAQVLRTDIDGLVELRTRGDVWRVQTHRRGDLGTLANQASKR